DLGSDRVDQVSRRLRLEFDPLALRAGHEPPREIAGGERGELDRAGLLLQGLVELRPGALGDLPDEYQDEPRYLPIEGRLDQLTRARGSGERLYLPDHHHAPLRHHRRGLQDRAEGLGAAL